MMAFCVGSLISMLLFHLKTKQPSATAGGARREATARVRVGSVARTKRLTVKPKSCIMAPWIRSWPLRDEISIGASEIKIIRYWSVVSGPWLERFEESFVLARLVLVHNLRP